MSNALKLKAELDKSDTDFDNPRKFDWLRTLAKYDIQSVSNWLDNTLTLNKI